MPGNVNLNIPPRLIESARAAQYANREALDSRVLSEKIKAKVKARHAAVLRQQPVTPDRAGGLLETGDPLKWRIWRKRRAGRRVVYTIEGQRTFYATPPKGFDDKITIYAEWDTQPRRPIFEVGGGYQSINNVFVQVPRTVVYLSSFVGANGEEAPPLIGFAAYGPVGFLAGSVAGAKGYVRAASWDNPFPFDSFPAPSYSSGILDISPIIIFDNEISLLASTYNPLHAWDRLPANIPNDYGTTSANPLANEYDVDRIKLAPGYEQTSSVALTEEATYSVSATIKP
jgi:hypothetical protein